MTHRSPNSPLHRLLRIQPGLAPRWFCSRDLCAGLDLLSLFPAVLFFASLGLGRRYGWAPALLIASPLLPLAWLSERFTSAERWARARRRRGECPSCGRAGIGAGASYPCRRT